MISLFLVVLAAACYDEEKDKEESSDDGSPEIIFTTTCTCRLNLGMLPIKCHFVRMILFPPLIFFTELLVVVHP